MKLIAALIVSTSLLSTVVLANEPAAAAAAPAAKAEKKAPKPDLNAGSAKYAQVCASCHNADGNSSIAINPKLAGQHPEYLMKQLDEFKSGKRNNPVMMGMAATLVGDDVRNVSYWLAAQAPKAGFAKDRELVALGEKIYKGGLADRQIAACAGCHSPTGAGIPSQFPRLSGQNAEYTVAQLIAFRDGVRKNSVQMSQVAAKMSDKEMKAVADYIAGLR